jgi:hypothetical protein
LCPSGIGYEIINALPGSPYTPFGKPPVTSPLAGSETGLQAILGVFWHIHRQSPLPSTEFLHRL